MAIICTIVGQAVYVEIKLHCLPLFLENSEYKLYLSLKDLIKKYKIVI